MATESMRVLHVTSSLDPIAGGVASAVATLAAAQARAGLRPMVVGTWVTLPAADVADQLRRQGVEVETVQAREPRSWYPDMARMARRWVDDADVVHVHALWEQVQYHTARAARRAGKPYVVTPHGMLAGWAMNKSGWGKRLYLALRLRRNLDGASLVHYTSAAERDGSVAAGIRATPVVEPNGLDLAEFSPPPARGSFRAAHPGIGTRPIVLFLGRLHPKKGLDLLVPAFAKALRGMPPAEVPVLVLAGPDEGGYRHTVERWVRENDLAGHVVFTGMLRGPDRISALVDADLFCLPSYNENFGIVVAESLAAGCPVVVSDQVNIHSDVTETGVGQVVPCDVPALAGALRRWMTDAGLRAAASASAPAVARARYDSDAVARHWVDHYARIVGRQPAVTPASPGGTTTPIGSPHAQ
jgi:glycosyltransferase involved in cell wall biosynthesis